MTRGNFTKEVSTKVGKRKYQKKKKQGYFGEALQRPSDVSKPLSGSQIAKRQSKRM